MDSETNIGAIREVRTPRGLTRYLVDVQNVHRRERRRFYRRREAELFLSKLQLLAAEGQFLPARESVSLLQLAKEFLADSKARKSKKTFLDVDSARFVRFVKFVFRVLHGGQVVVARYRFPEIVMGGERPPDLNDEEKALVMFMRRLKLDRITGELLERYQQHLLGEIKPVSVKGYLTTLKVALNLAVRRGWIGRNPASLLPRVVIAKRTPRFLLKNEIAMLLRSAREHSLFGLVAIGIFAGLRRGELTHLEWPDVDFDINFIRVRVKPDWAPKWMRERDVPLEPLLKEALSPLHRTSGLCFPTDRGTTRDENVLRDLKALAKRAGLKQSVSVHGLRHTYGSHMAMAGVPLTDISAWMGHTTLSTTLLYAHLAPGRNRFRRDSVFEVANLESLLAEGEKDAVVVKMPASRKEAK